MTVKVIPLVWEKTIIPPSGKGSREDFGGWTMRATTPLVEITIDYHASHEKKGLNTPYYSRTCGGYFDESEAIAATEKHYEDAVLASVTGG